MSGVMGLILAGGQSRRMGRDKAFVAFRGRPMIAHAIARLAPQVAQLAISANGEPARFAEFGLPVLPDATPEFPGPLAGVHAGLRYAAGQGAAALVTIPCDAPFAPTDLVARLSAGGVAAPAVATREGRVEPLFALWPVVALAEVGAALAREETAVWRLLRRLGAREVEIRPVAGEDWARNLNSPEELREAEE